MRSNTLDGVIAAATGKLQVVLRNHELPPLSINAVLTHNKLLSGKVRALLEFLVENLASKDFDTVPAFGKAKSGIKRASVTAIRE
jgi:hypothetical protein